MILFLIKFVFYWLIWNILCKFGIGAMFICSVLELCDINVGINNFGGVISIPKLAISIIVMMIFCLNDFIDILFKLNNKLNKNKENFKRYYY